MRYKCSRTRRRRSASSGAGGGCGPLAPDDYVAIEQEKARAAESARRSARGGGAVLKT